MTISFDRFRRGATQLAIRAAIAATAPVPDRIQQCAILALARLLARIPALRRRLRENIRLALDCDAPAGIEKLYFRHWAWVASNSLLTFHRGVAATPVMNDVTFDDSFRLFEQAVAEGRGVILVAPHWIGHELATALISRTYPITMLVRQAPTEERMARKLKWYRELGVEILLRPRTSSNFKDALAYLKVLKAGKVLALTPDLLASPGQGVVARVFGRDARLPGGAFMLSMMAQAPMIRGSMRWESDSRAVLMFERVDPPRNDGDRDAAVQEALEDWCRWFEGKLLTAPENWLFWLDKRWTRFLRATPRISS